MSWPYQEALQIGLSAIKTMKLSLTKTNFKNQDFLEAIKKQQSAMLSKNF